MSIEYGAWLPYIISEVLPYGVIGGASYLAWRFVRAYERQSVAPHQVLMLAERLERVEETIEQVHRGVEQSAEAHRFTTQVLLSRESHPRQQDRRVVG
jgi:hypothetical protein